MRIRHLATGLLFIGSLSASPGTAFAATTGDLTFFAGQRDLYDEVWELFDLDKQIALGVAFTLGSPNLPIFLDTGAHFSFDDSTIDGVDENGNSGELDLDAFLSEIYVGGLIAPLHGQTVSPYVGAGATVITAKIKVDSDISGDLNGSETDTAFGYYARAGLDFNLGKRFMIGADVRYLGGAKLKYEGGFNVDADYLQYGLTMGFRWGGGDSASSASSSRTVMPPSHRVAAPPQVVPPVAPAPEVVSPTPAVPAPPLVPRTPPKTSNVLGTAAALRDQPHLESTGTVLVPAGSTLTMLRQVSNAEGRWHFVRFGRDDGWIPESALQ